MFGPFWTYLYLNPWMPWMPTLPGPTRSAYDHGMSEGPCVTWSLVFWLTGGRNPRMYPCDAIIAPDLLRIQLTLW